MAFFRKKQKTDDAMSDRRREAMDKVNQQKWDELERLVSDQAASKAAERAPQPEVDADPLPDLSELQSDLETPNTSEPNLEFGGHDMLDVSVSELTADLKVDMSDGSEFIDVTPEEQLVQAPLEAMTPSSHFKPVAEEVKAPQAEQPILERPKSRFVDTPPAVDRPARADLGAMRLDVARISADIQSGEELYRRAQQRIEKLTNFVERAEIDFSMLNRLEPENRRLKARNRTIEREIDATNQKIEVLRVDLEDRERRLAEKTRVYEASLSKLSVAKKSLQEFERALNLSRESSDRNALNSERLQTSLDVERRENEILRVKLTEVVGEMDSKQTAYIESKKVADSLAQDCADFRHQAEAAEKDADKLRKALATAQTQNNAMKSEMMGLHEDIRSFKTQSEFTIISREDELAALQQQIDQLTKQLEIKDDIVRNAARDVQELRKIRTAQDLERERLEAQIETQAYQLDQANSDLLRTKQDVSDFDRRYRDVATALSVSQARRMSNEPAAVPDIQPVESNEMPEDTTPAADEFTDLTESDIEDRIMDFRLGLRDDIT